MSTEVDVWRNVGTAIGLLSFTGALAYALLRGLVSDMKKGLENLQSLLTAVSNHELRIKSLEGDLARMEGRFMQKIDNFEQSIHRLELAFTSLGTVREVKEEILGVIGARITDQKRA